MNTSEGAGRGRGVKSREAFRTISEVADELDLPQHVLRFWESKFSQIKPLKRGGNRRYYRPDDVQVLTAIKKLLHSDGYTIRGVQKLFKSQGLKATLEQVHHSDQQIVTENLPPESNLTSDTAKLETSIQKLKALRNRLA